VQPAPVEEPPGQRAPTPMSVLDIKELKPTPRDTTQAPPAIPPMERKTHTFKPLTDKLAQRSAILSVVGLFLFFVPIVSLAGALGGMWSLRRIRRSDGLLSGEGTAKLAIWVGLAGVVIGAIVLTAFALKG
jgi:hypothetical protein